VLGPAPPRPRLGEVGIEHEYALLAGDEQLDFRVILERAEPGGVQADPADPFAHRLASGLVLTADEREAEVASPPVPVRPGFTMALAGWATAGREAIEATVPAGATLRGYSTHISISMEPGIAVEVAGRWAQVYAAAWMVIVQRREAHGVMIRPRPGRLEFCGDFAAGERLRAAAAFVAGTTLHLADCVREGRLPASPILDVAIDPASIRWGYEVRRFGFGPDLLAGGRRAIVCTFAGEAVTAQELLEGALRDVEIGLRGRAFDRDLEPLREMVAGRRPLGVEEPSQAGESPRPLPREDLGAVALPPALRVRGVNIEPVTATWASTTFRLAAAGREPAYVVVPRPYLARFLREFGRGRLEGAFDAYLAGDGGGALETWQQTLAPGMFRTMAEPASLLPPEPGFAPAAVAESSGHAAWMTAVASLPRPGKAPEPPPVRPPDDGPGGATQPGPRPSDPGPSPGPPPIPEPGGELPKPGQPARPGPAPTPAPADGPGPGQPERPPRPPATPPPVAPPPPLPPPIGGLKPPSSVYQATTPGRTHPAVNGTGAVPGPGGKTPRLPLLPALIATVLIVVIAVVAVVIAVSGGSPTEPVTAGETVSPGTGAESPPSGGGTTTGGQAGQSPSPGAAVSPSPADPAGSTENPTPTATPTPTPTGTTPGNAASPTSGIAVTPTPTAGVVVTPTPTSGVAITPTPTATNTSPPAVLSGNRTVTFQVSANPGNHPCGVGPTMEVNFFITRAGPPEDGVPITITVTIPGFATLNGNTVFGPGFNSQGGSATAAGSGTYCGFTTSFSMSFTISPGGVSGTLVIGGDGTLPGGQPITFNFSGGGPH